MEAYQRLLEKFLVARNAPYRSDPERVQAMLPVIEHTLVTILQKLATYEGAEDCCPECGAAWVPSGGGYSRKHSDTCSQN